MCWCWICIHWKEGGCSGEVGTAELSPSMIDAKYTVSRSRHCSNAPVCRICSRLLFASRQTENEQLLFNVCNRHVLCLAILTGYYDLGYICGRCATHVDWGSDDEVRGGGPMIPPLEITMCPHQYHQYHQTGLTVAPHLYPKSPLPGPRLSSARPGVASPVEHSPQLSHNRPRLEYETTDCGAACSIAIPRPVLTVARLHHPLPLRPMPH